MERGKADVALMDLGTPDVSALRVRYGPRLHTDPTAATIFAFLNVDKPPFNDVNVRRALNYAVDRGRLAELLGSRQTHVPTCQLLPPGFPGYTPACRFTVNPNPAGTWTGPDLERARRLVAASGTRGMKVEFWGVHGLPLEPVGRYFRSLLHKLGYRASLHTIGDLHPIGDAASGPPATRPQLGLWGWGAISAAPYAFAAPLVSCARIVNHSHFCDRKLDALMAEAENARGRPQRRALAAGRGRHGPKGADRPPLQLRHRLPRRAPGGQLAAQPDLGTAAGSDVGELDAPGAPSADRARSSPQQQNARNPRRGREFRAMELGGLEPPTSWVRSRRSPN